MLHAEGGLAHAAPHGERQLGTACHLDSNVEVDLCVDWLTHSVGLAVVRTSDDPHAANLRSSGPAAIDLVARMTRDGVGSESETCVDTGGALDAAAVQSHRVPGDADSVRIGVLCLIPKFIGCSARSFESDPLKGHGLCAPTGRP